MKYIKLFEGYKEEKDAEIERHKLAKYNEDSSARHTCKDLIGYTYIELKDIFELNLEDNPHFDLIDISGFGGKKNHQ
jgi:hypothetical protein